MQCLAPECRTSDSDRIRTPFSWAPATLSMALNHAQREADNPSVPGIYYKNDLQWFVDNFRHISPLTPSLFNS